MMNKDGESMKSYVKELISSMSYKNSMRKETAVARYTPAEIALKLSSLPDTIFDEYALCRDPLYGKLTPELCSELSEKARACGQAEAKKLVQQYPGKTPIELCEMLGIRQLRQVMPQDKTRVVYAQFVEPDEITIFTDCLDTAARYAQTEGLLSVLRTEILEQILLAHELFHVIEERDSSLFTRAYRLNLWNFGPVHNNSPLVVLGEIAGMAFAKELMQMDFCPFVLDALLLYGYDADAACGVCDEMLGYVREKGNTIC
jgi:hypothetical protein